MLRALLAEKDAEYVEMCQQFEGSLQSKNQQMKLLETNFNKVTLQFNVLQTELTTKTAQINNLQLTVSVIIIVIVTLML